MPQAIPAVIGGAASLIGSKMASDSAGKAARKATPVPYSVSGPAGLFGVDPATRQITLSQGDNPFAAIFQALGLGQLGRAGLAGSQFLHGANPEVASAYRGVFGQGLTSEIQNQLALLREAAAPEENRQQLGLDDRLFSRGMLGTSGGAEQQRALQEAFAAADLQRQLASVGLGRENALNRFQAAMGAVGQGMAGQQQAFNFGQGSFGSLNQLFQQLIQQGNLGLGAMSGTPQEAAIYAAQQSQLPFQTAFNFLNQSGIFAPRGGNPIFPGGGVPMVNQPGGPITGINPTSPFPMPSVPGF